MTTVTLAHGAGGRASDDLLRRVILPALGTSTERALCDSAVFDSPGGRIAFTTDGFTVTPLFFPGSSIGRLAVFGTVNDLAMAGAIPHALSLAMVAEEGLAMNVMRRVLEDVGAASAEAGVRIVTGDTKVVGRGAVDKLFLTTSGIGVIGPGTPPLSPERARPGDAILVSGTVGDHGVAVLAARENLSFSPTVESDCAPLADLVQRLLAAAPGTRCLRDPTRGGIAATLNEFAHGSRAGIEVDEDTIPIRRPVRALCEILGLDPLYLANEGKLVAVVDALQADAALAALRCHPQGAEACILGRMTADHPGTVVIRTELGTHRIVEYPTGELLPRIC
ncbi:hydrogenase expression/formation protein HypE [Candidatus Fermentibacteria bacterium]|nr:hydrogenase expression/formation protein HypE [Candidatus Fermentibacteria bacterium]